MMRDAFAHRSRAALTLLGIVIGTSAIVLIASLVRGGRSFLVHANQSVAASDLVEVVPEDPPPEQHDKTTRPLSRADARALERALPHAAVDGESTRKRTATFEGRKKRVTVVSAGPDTLPLYRLAIHRGRMLDADDVTATRRVCVVGQEVYDELLRSGPLATMRLAIDGHLFAVVGVLAKKPILGSTDSTDVWDRKVLMPETVFDALYTPSHELTRLYVRTAETKAARLTTTGVLLRRHYDVLNFTLGADQSGGTEALVLGVIQILLLGAGVLALFASGINIMNVMLVTVSERRREIGLRRALGATKRSILAQFLAEATVLSFVGGIAGVVVGIALACGIGWLARAGLGHWTIAIEPWSLGLGLGLALVTGAAFGLAPAWRAANVSPIEALRSE